MSRYWTPKALTQTADAPLLFGRFIDWRNAGPRSSALSAAPSALFLSEWLVCPSSARTPLSCLLCRYRARLPLSWYHPDLQGNEIALLLSHRCFHHSASPGRLSRCSHYPACLYFPVIRDASVPKQELLLGLTDHSDFLSHMPIQQERPICPFTVDGLALVSEVGSWNAGLCSVWAFKCTLSPEGPVA